MLSRHQPPLPALRICLQGDLLCLLCLLFRCSAAAFSSRFGARDTQSSHVYRLVSQKVVEQCVWADVTAQSIPGTWLRQGSPHRGKTELQHHALREDRTPASCRLDCAGGRAEWASETPTEQAGREGIAGLGHWFLPIRAAWQASWWAALASRGLSRFKIVGWPASGCSCVRGLAEGSIGLHGGALVSCCDFFHSPTLRLSNCQLVGSHVCSLAGLGAGLCRQVGSLAVHPRVQLAVWVGLFLAAVSTGVSN